MSETKKTIKLRSAEWFGTQDKNGFMYRSWMKNQGIPDHEFRGKPIIGIAQTGSDLTPCNRIHMTLVHRVKDGIRDGDYVIVARRVTAQNGQTVVALVRGEATLKRYYSEGARIRLQPANATMKPLMADARDVTVQGVVTGLIRDYASA